MATYLLQRKNANQNELLQMEMEVHSAVSPQEAVMFAAIMASRLEIPRRVSPLVRMMAAAPTAGSWEYDNVRYWMTKWDD